jgi:predicted negative regulator of RcsB-dependent stress response
MDDFLTEEEQWERVKLWLRQNGPSIIIGIAIAAAALGGWRWWQSHKEQRLISASDAYHELLDTFNKNDLALAEKQTDALVAAYAGTGFADQAELAAARLQIENGHDAPAVRRLEHVMKTSADPGLALTARLRLARVQIDQGQPDAALATLAAVEPGAFTSRFAEVRGDALLAKGDREGALAAYREAQAASLDGAGADLLELKINDLIRS